MHVDVNKYAASKEGFLKIVESSKDPIGHITITCVSIGLPLIAGYAFYGSKHGYDTVLPIIQKLVDFYHILDIIYADFPKESIVWPV